MSKWMLRLAVVVSLVTGPAALALRDGGMAKKFKEAVLHAFWCFAVRHVGLQTAVLLLFILCVFGCVLPVSFQFSCG